MFLFKKTFISRNYRFTGDYRDSTESFCVSSMLTSYIIMVKYQNLETLLVIKNVLLSLLWGSILPLIAQLLAYLYRNRSVKCDLYGDKKRNSWSRDIKAVIEVLILVTFCFPDGKHFMIHAEDKHSLYIFSRNLLIYLICLHFVVLAFLRNTFFFCFYTNTLLWWEASHCDYPQDSILGHSSVAPYFW